MPIKAVMKETGEILGEVEFVDNGESPKTDKADRSRENSDFVMLYRMFIQQIADLGMKDAQALRVLLFLIRHMDTKNALAVPMNVISDMLGLSRQTVSSKIKFLANNGWIEVYKLGKSNVYTVNPDVVWTSYADQKSTCKFEANLLLSSVDNWAILNKKKNQMTLRHIDREVLKTLAEKEFPDSLEKSPESE